MQTGWVAERGTASLFVKQTQFLAEDNCKMFPITYATIIYLYQSNVTKSCSLFYDSGEAWKNTWTLGWLYQSLVLTIEMNVYLLTLFSKTETLEHLGQTNTSGLQM